MAEALRQAVTVGSGGVRAYLGRRPLGDITTDGGGMAPIVTAIEYIADGLDAEAAVVLEQTLNDKAGVPLPAVALLALTHLLQGEDVEADEVGVRQVPVTAEGQAGGR